MIGAMEIQFDPPDAQQDLPGTALQQTGRYARVMCALGCDTAVADIREDGALLGRARIHIRRFGPLRLAWLPCGPVWTDASTPAAQRAALAALPRAAPFRALWAVGGATDRVGRGWRVARGRQVAELDLRPGDACRRAALHGKWRNCLTRAERAGLTVTARPLALPGDAALLDREDAQRRTRGYAALPRAFTESWAALAPEATLMLTALHAGRPAAFMLLLLHAPTATYHIGWTGAEGRASGAHALLLWRAGEILSCQGYTRLDLGLIDPARAPGLARFKLRAGATARDPGATILCL